MKCGSWLKFAIYERGLFIFTPWWYQISLHISSDAYFLSTVLWLRSATEIMNRVMDSIRQSWCCSLVQLRVFQYKANLYFYSTTLQKGNAKVFTYFLLLSDAVCTLRVKLFDNLSVPMQLLTHCSLSYCLLFSVNQVMFSHVVNVRTYSSFPEH